MCGRNDRNSLCDRDHLFLRYTPRIYPQTFHIIRCYFCCKTKLNFIWIPLNLVLFYEQVFPKGCFCLDRLESESGKLVESGRHAIHLTFSSSSSHVYYVFCSLYIKLSFNCYVLSISANIPLSSAYLYFFVILLYYSVKSTIDIAWMSILLNFKASNRKVWSFASELPNPYGNALSNTRLNYNKLTIFMNIICNAYHKSLHNSAFSFSLIKLVIM